MPRNPAAFASAARSTSTAWASARCALSAEGVWGPPEDRAEAMRTLRAPARSRRRLHRHRRFLWPRLLRKLIREGARALRHDPCRDQGRAGANGAERLDSARPARISDPAGLQEPLAARRRDDRLVAAPSHRCEGAGERAVRRHQVADQGRRHPLRRPFRSQRRGDRGGLEGVPGRDGAEPLQSHRQGERGGARLLRRRKASASSPGSRSTPASWRAKARRSTPSPASTRRARARSRSPGS